MHRKPIFFFSLLMVLFLAGCGGGGPPANVKNGQALFNQSVIGKGPGCSTCHSLSEKQVWVGPSLAGIATQAVKRIPEIAADDYLRRSILEPDAFLVPGFAAGTMPKTYSSELKPEQLADLVAFLMTLK